MSNPCKGCIYSFATNCGTYCQYILITEHRRPCPPGRGCTVKKVQKAQKGAKKMRLIDADEMAANESEAYMSAQTKIDSPITLAINSCVHRKIQKLIADTPTIDPEIPAADVATVRHARWEEADWIEPDCHGFGIIRTPKAALRCSNCKNCFKKELLWKDNYCPNCGARMEE